MPLREAVQRLREMLEDPVLTKPERQLLDLLKARVSDREIGKRLKLSSSEALRATNALRVKLDVRMGETLRDAAKRQGL